MKPRCPSPEIGGLTRLDVLIIVFVLAVLATTLLPALAAAKHKSAKIHCANNLKQLGLAFQIKEGDYNDSYPMNYLAANNPATTVPVDPSVEAAFRMMSNELSGPFILICPADEHCKPARNLNIPLTSSNISYFINMDAREVNPQDLMSGDDNFEIGGSPIESGLWEITSNTPIAWSAARHRFFGNIALADGSVMGANNSALRSWLRSTNSVPIRFAIP